MIDCLLLLYSDRSDPVSRVLLEQPGRFDREVIAISAEQLADEVTIGPQWTWSGRVIDPERTAVVNRLASAPAATGYFTERQAWVWLRTALRSFAYASSLPTATSVSGDYGSLLDQWQDLPELVAGLRVPVHARPWTGEAVHGDVYRVDPWRLYSLGTNGPAAGDGLLHYIRPRGPMVHVAQVGETLLLANVPPGMTARQQSYIVSFVGAMASASGTRILEHAFFIGDDLPVFYSTCPTPVITGSLADYPALLVQGLQDDIARRAVRAPSQTQSR